MLHNHSGQDTLRSARERSDEHGKMFKPARREKIEYQEKKGNFFRYREKMTETESEKRWEPPQASPACVSFSLRHEKLHLLFQNMKIASQQDQSHESLNSLRWEICARMTSHCVTSLNSQFHWRRSDSVPVFFLLLSHAERSICAEQPRVFPQSMHFPKKKTLCFSSHSLRSLSSLYFASNKIRYFMTVLVGVRVHRRRRIEFLRSPCLCFPFFSVFVLSPTDSESFATKSSSSQRLCNHAWLALLCDCVMSPLSICFHPLKLISISHSMLKGSSTIFPPTDGRKRRRREKVSGFEAFRFIPENFSPS